MFENLPVCIILGYLDGVVEIVNLNRLERVLAGAGGLAFGSNFGGNS